MKRVSFIIVFIISSLLTFAMSVDLEKASLVAKNFYYERSGGDTFIISEVHPVIRGLETIMYCFDGDIDQGFVIVAADTRVYPVLGYSFNGNFVHDTLLQSSSFKWLMDHYAGQIIYVKDYSTSATQEAIDAWNHYGEGENFSSLHVETVLPLLGNNAWGQGCFYNAMCPADNTAASYCYRALVGCAATSMSQVMWYWSYPSQGIGSHTYTHPVYGNLSADFGATNYDWAAMPESLSGYNTAVATISYHAGVSIEMNYGPTGSGALPSSIRPALVDHFGYSSSADNIVKDNFANSVWESIIRAEHDSLRPVLYYGYNPNTSGGHGWVVDGYQGTSSNHFHCNWGWNGSLNGYFYLNALTPGSSNYNANQGAIVGIVPQSTDPPMADFAVNKDTAYVSEQVIFADLSAGYPNQWKWYFGDGDSSTLQNPVHVYDQPGNFDVTLIAYNLHGSDTITKTNVVNVIMPPLPVVDFVATPTTVHEGNPVYFTDQSQYFPLSWKWYFGDGDSSNLQNPAHIYNTPGVYSVKLVADNISGRDSVIKTDFITVTPAPPTADFDAYPLIVYPGDTVFFVDQSTQTATEWFWDFGDGDTSTAQNPVHIYTESGAYTVTLTASNINGSTNISRPFYIYVIPLPPLPMAYFTASPSTILSGENVEFFDFSTSNPEKWEWTFPGGTPNSSTSKHPGQITYNDPGHFDVMLVVSNVTGSDTMIRENYIVVGSIGIENINGKNSYVYPVPASDKIYVSSEYQIKSIKLYDINGRVLRQWNTENSLYQQKELDVTSIPDGIYLLNVETNKGQAVHKVVIFK